MAHAVDLLVDVGFLLDVGVRARDIGLGLIVVVVGDEVLDGVAGEEALHLPVELGRERLVRREDERRALGRGDDMRHGEGLARAGDAEQHLRALVLADALHQLGDRLWLVALRLELRDEPERPPALALLGALGTMRHEHGHAAGDEWVRGEHGLPRKDFLRPLGALGGLCEEGVQRVGEALAADRRPRPLLAQRGERGTLLFPSPRTYGERVGVRGRIRRHRLWLPLTPTLSP